MLNASGRRGYPLSWFTVGLAIGASATGGVVYLLGSVISFASLGYTPMCVTAAILLATLVAREFGVVTFSLPEARRLVPETVFRHGLAFGPLQFGIEMGSGVRTYVSSTMPYMLCVVVLLFPDLAGTALAAGGFAAGRAVMAWLSVYSGDPGAWDVRFRSLRIAKKLALVLFLTGAATIMLLALP